MTNDCIIECDVCGSINWTLRGNKKGEINRAECSGSNCNNNNIDFIKNPEVIQKK